jgi:hypothetical protein
MQTSSILNQAVVVGLVTSQLPPLQDTPPIIMVDLLQPVDFLHQQIRLTYYMHWFLTSTNMVDLLQAVNF